MLVVTFNPDLGRGRRPGRPEGSNCRRSRHSVTLSYTLLNVPWSLNPPISHYSLMSSLLKTLHCILYLMSLALGPPYFVVYFKNLDLTYLMSLALGPPLLYRIYLYLPSGGLYTHFVVCSTFSPPPLFLTKNLLKSFFTQILASHPSLSFPILSYDHIPLSTPHFVVCFKNWS